MRKIFFVALVSLFTNSAIRNVSRNASCHSEHPKGAWRSLWKRRDCFVALAMILLIAVSGLSLFACAGVEPRGKSLSEDLGSPEKVELLRERAYDFWSAFVKKDYETVFSIYDPFFQARTDVNSFSGKILLTYHEFEIKDIKVEGNVAKVKLNIVYSMEKVAFKDQEFSQPETEAEFEETWLYIYDNWYREYYLESVGAGYAKY